LQIGEQKDFLVTLPNPPQWILLTATPPYFIFVLPTKFQRNATVDVLGSQNPIVINNQEFRETVPFNRTRSFQIGYNCKSIYYLSFVNTGNPTLVTLVVQIGKFSIFNFHLSVTKNLTLQSNTSFQNQTFEFRRSIEDKQIWRFQNTIPCNNISILVNPQKEYFTGKFF
jgi:hypothetical protein